MELCVKPVGNLKKKNNNLIMKYGNCVIYAVPKFISKGGYLIFSWSPRNNYIPHVSYSRDLIETEEFVPITPKKGWLGVFSSPFFKGKIKKKKLNSHE